MLSHSLLLLGSLTIGGLCGVAFKVPVVSKRYAKLKAAYAREVKRRNDADRDINDLTNKIIAATGERDDKGRFKKVTKHESL